MLINTIVVPERLYENKVDVRKYVYVPEVEYIIYFF